MLFSVATSSSAATLASKVTAGKTVDAADVRYKIPTWWVIEQFSRRFGVQTLVKVPGEQDGCFYLGVLQVAAASSLDGQKYFLRWHLVSVIQCLVVEGCERSAFSLVPYVDEESIWFLCELGGSQLDAMNPNGVQLCAATNTNHHHESRSAGSLLAASTHRRFDLPLLRKIPYGADNRYSTTRLFGRVHIF
jgi:hypothetical protein